MPGRDEAFKQQFAEAQKRAILEAAQPAPMQMPQRTLTEVSIKGNIGFDVVLDPEGKPVLCKMFIVDAFFNTVYSWEFIPDRIDAFRGAMDELEETIRKIEAGEEEQETDDHITTGPQ